jgi:3-hydroxyacyl-CoA dehydrogenase / 3-hydroxy-2-methylbutyryl-CoA dehydrogenase
MSPANQPEFAGLGALVTGGASGLGEGTVRRLHALGSHVVIADTAEERAREIATELGERATAIRCDVGDADDVAAAISAAEDAPRALRVAVACAGIGFGGELVDGGGNPHPLDTFERHLRVNLVGVFNVLRLAVTSMRKNEPGQDGERGVVVLTGSVSGLEGVAGEAQYASSKGGVHSLTLPAARECGQWGIRVNTIVPGPFSTGMMSEQPEEMQDAYAQQLAFPKRMGYPDEFASLAQEVIVNRMINGALIRIDGAVNYG